MYLDDAEMDVYDFVQNGHDFCGRFVLLLSQQHVEEDEVSLLTNGCLHLSMSMNIEQL